MALERGWRPYTGLFQALNLCVYTEVTLAGIAEELHSEIPVESIVTRYRRMSCTICIVRLVLHGGHEHVLRKVAKTQVTGPTELAKPSKLLNCLKCFSATNFGLIWHVQHSIRQVCIPETRLCDDPIKTLPSWHSVCLHPIYHDHVDIHQDIKFGCAFL